MSISVFMNKLPISAVNHSPLLFTCGDMLCCMFNFQDLPDDVRIAQEKKLEELKRQQELQNQLAVQRTVQLRDRKIKFFGMLLLIWFVPIHLWCLSFLSVCTYTLLDVGVQTTKRGERLRG